MACEGTTCEAGGGSQGQSHTAAPEVRSPARRANLFQLLVLIFDSAEPATTIRFFPDLPLPDPPRANPPGVLGLVPILLAGAARWGRAGRWSCLLCCARASDLYLYNDVESMLFSERRRPEEQEYLNPTWHGQAGGEVRAQLFGLHLEVTMH